MTGEQFLKLHGDKLTNEEKELLTFLLKYKLSFSEHLEVVHEQSGGFYVYTFGLREGKITVEIKIKI